VRRAPPRQGELVSQPFGPFARQSLTHVNNQRHGDRRGDCGSGTRRRRAAVLAVDHGQPGGRRLPCLSRHVPTRTVRAPRRRARGRGGARRTRACGSHRPRNRPTAPLSGRRDTPGAGRDDWRGLRVAAWRVLRPRHCSPCCPCRHSLQVKGSHDTHQCAAQPEDFDRRPTLTLKSCEKAAKSVLKTNASAAADGAHGWTSMHLHRERESAKRTPATAPSRCYQTLTPAHAAGMPARCEPACPGRWPACARSTRHGRSPSPRG